MSFTTDVAGSGAADFSAAAEGGTKLSNPIVSIIGGMLTNPSDAGSATESIKVYLINFSDLFKDFSSGVLWILGQVNGAWAWAQQPAKDIGKDFETIQGNDQDALLHLKNTILPKSLKWLQGFIFSTGIVPLRNDVHKLDDRVSFLDGWRGQINTWRKDYVDPQIEDWRQFHHWFDTNAAPSIATLRGWISKPATFSDFAVPAIARPLLTYIASDKHNTLQDDWSQLMTSAWVDRPNTTWELILQWVVSDG